MKQMSLKIEDKVVDVELTNTVVNGFRFVYVLQDGQRVARHRLPDRWLLEEDKRRVFTSGKWYAKA